MRCEKPTPTRAGDDRLAEVAKTIVHTIERRFAEHGATPSGLYWPKAEDIAVRYAAGLLPVLSGLRKTRISLFDFGCGCGFLLDWLSANGFANSVDYVGFDASKAIISEAQRRWPKHRFVQGDLFSLSEALPGARRDFDVVVAFGIFTARFSVSEHAMKEYAEKALLKLWEMTRSCLIFNAMSIHVDWKRDDLFHWPLDDVVDFARKNMSRFIDIAGSYGLWEHMFRVWRSPQRMPMIVPRTWMA